MLRNLILLFAFASLVACGEAHPNEVEVEYVYDGDTITVVRLGDQEHVRIRLMGYDTAEIKSSKCAREKALALEQKDALASLIGDSIILQVEGKDRYGRTLAWGFTAVGQSVSEYMISEHNARPYDGGKRRSWC
ncbi:MAG: thermonuclease family protein [Alphaproteobacteria bacterium]|nr:thermonuclease family protein [Alphaproteobacteria bacterium]